MGYVNGEWVDDNDPFKTPYTSGSGSEGSSAIQLQPQTQAPAPAGNPRDQNEVNYGNGVVAKKTANGWQYDALGRSYADLLGDQEVADQLKLRQMRSAATAAGKPLDAGDAAILHPNTSAISAAQSGGASQNQFNLNYPGFQFNDPYTNLLEQTAQSQMQALQQPQQNPALDTFLKFLGDRFNTLTTTPGYSPEDLAVLRTQALEPIEQDRAASNQRALQKAAQGGYLPTSGITQLTAAPNGGTETIDQNFDRTRAAVQRDLAINAINKRSTDLNQAVQIGQMSGVQIPQIQRAEDQQRRNELVQLAQLLYNLPRQSMLDAESVINGSPSPTDVYNQVARQQQQQQANDAALWSQIGNLIAGMAF